MKRPFRLRKPPFYPLNYEDSAISDFRSRIADFKCRTRAITSCSTAAIASATAARALRTSFGFDGQQHDCEYLCDACLYVNRYVSERKRDLRLLSCALLLLLLQRRAEVFAGIIAKSFFQYCCRGELACVITRKRNLKRLMSRQGIEQGEKARLIRLH